MVDSGDSDGKGELGERGVTGESSDSDETGA